MTFFVRRRLDGSIASVHQNLRAGYAEEELADDNAELIAVMAAIKGPTPLTVEALAAALEKKGALTKADVDEARGKK
jgi:hypothetical protein